MTYTLLARYSCEICGAVADIALNAEDIPAGWERPPYLEGTSESPDDPHHCKDCAGAPWKDLL